MDWITHFMVAFILGRALKLDRNGMIAVTLGALVLDADVVFYILPGTLSHGTVTHTLAGGVLLGLACAVGMKAWKGASGWHLVALGIASHLALDMVNTLSVFDGGKMLLYPFSGTVFTLKDYIHGADLAWAVITAAVFAASAVAMLVSVSCGDHPWRVWFDERPALGRWKRASRRYTRDLPRMAVRYAAGALSAILAACIVMHENVTMLPGK